MAKKVLRIICNFVLKFFSRENVDELIDQLIDALYERYQEGVDNTNV